MRLNVYILLFFLVACKASQPKETPVTPTEQKNTEPQIAFYFLEASKKTDNSIGVKLNKQKIVKGKLKEIYLDKILEDKILNANWLVGFLNNSNKSIIQLQITNPLVEEVEYVNEEGYLEKKTIYHDTKAFVLRVPYHNSIKIINFEEFRIINQKITPFFIDQIIIK